MKSKSYILIALATLAVALTPTLALAQRNPLNGGHVRSVSFHDRTPHAHEHFAAAHH